MATDPLAGPIGIVLLVILSMAALSISILLAASCLHVCRSYKEKYRWSKRRRKASYAMFDDGGDINLFQTRRDLIQPESHSRIQVSLVPKYHQNGLTSSLERTKTYRYSDGDADSESTELLHEFEDGSRTIERSVSPSHPFIEIDKQRNRTKLSKIGHQRPVKDLFIDRTLDEGRLFHPASPSQDISADPIAAEIISTQEAPRSFTPPQFPNSRRTSSFNSSKLGNLTVLGASDERLDVPDLRLQRPDSVMETGHGRLTFSFSYLTKEQKLCFHLISGRRIYSQYRETCILPTITIEIEGFAESAVTSYPDDSPNPEYDQEFEFPLKSTDILDAVVRLTVCDVLSANEKMILGFVRVSLSSFYQTLAHDDGDGTGPLCREIKPYLTSFDASQTMRSCGELMTSLYYMSSKDEIHVTVHGGTDLKLVAGDAALYIKASLLLDNQVVNSKKSRDFSISHDNDIQFSWTFVFDALSQEDALFSPQQTSVKNDFLSPSYLSPSFDGNRNSLSGLRLLHDYWPQSTSSSLSLNLQRVDSIDDISSFSTASEHVSVASDLSPDGSFSSTASQSGIVVKCGNNAEGGFGDNSATNRTFRTSTDSNSAILCARSKNNANGNRTYTGDVQSSENQGKSSEIHLVVGESTAPTERRRGKLISQKTFSGSMGVLLSVRTKTIRHYKRVVGRAFLGDVGVADNIDGRVQWEDMVKTPDTFIWKRHMLLMTTEF